MMITTTTTTMNFFILAGQDRPALRIETLELFNPEPVISLLLPSFLDRLYYAMQCCLSSHTMLYLPALLPCTHHVYILPPCLHALYHTSIASHLVYDLHYHHPHTANQRMQQSRIPQSIHHHQHQQHSRESLDRQQHQPLVEQQPAGSPVQTRQTASIPTASNTSSNMSSLSVSYSLCLLAYP